MKAFCWRNGVIEFGRSVPPGTLEIASAPAKKLKPVIIATARLAKDKETLLVPGVPEAADDDLAMGAVLAYRRWIASRFEKEAS